MAEKSWQNVENSPSLTINLDFREILKTRLFHNFMNCSCFILLRHLALSSFASHHHCCEMAELVAGAAKKGKKTGAPEAPRFGRVRSNLKVSRTGARSRVLFCNITHYVMYRWVFLAFQTWESQACLI